LHIFSKSSLIFFFTFASLYALLAQVSPQYLVTIVRAVKALPQCLQVFGMYKLLLINGATWGNMVHHSPISLPTDLGNKSIYKATDIQQV